jgi:hypothetical protein
MKYKPGDKVKIKSLDWYNANKNSEGTIIFHGFRIFDENMSEFCGKVVTIESYNSRWYYYDIKEDEKVNFWYDEMFEDPAIEKEPQEKVVSLEDVCKWLRNNIDFYVETKYDEDFRVDIEQLLNDICKAM